MYVCMCVCVCDMSMYLCGVKNCEAHFQLVSQVCMYAYVYVYKYVCMHMYVCIWYMRVCMWIANRDRFSSITRENLCLRTHAYVYMCVYVCMYSWCIGHSDKPV